MKIEVSFMESIQLQWLVEQRIKYINKSLETNTLPKCIIDDMSEDLPRLEELVDKLKKVRDIE